MASKEIKLIAQLVNINMIKIFFLGFFLQFGDKKRVDKYNKGFFGNFLKTFVIS
jgi:hypothetical protein